MVNNSIGETSSQAWSLQVLCEWLELGPKWEDDEVTCCPGLTLGLLYRCSSEAACIHQPWGPCDGGEEGHLVL